MSRFGTLEASGYALVQAIPQLRSVKLTGEWSLNTTQPDLFPGAVCALGTPTMQKPDMAPSMGHASMRMRVPFVVVVYGSSDGLQTGDARYSAWTLADAVVDAFTAPMWQPASTDFGIIKSEMEQPTNILVDTGQSAVLLSFAVEIEWRT